MLLIKVRVTANARAEKVVKKADDHFVVSVKVKAERNEANRRVLEIVRSMYPGRSVRIIHGHQGPSKLIAID
ncbi:MAG: DUF167 domain-containing protein [Patescibacteria group bacterium]|nr:DUF167 domain-containing protein [Patescibacteria group bacterium]MDE2172837.1 DUF167 domain-containing protein [Patescibacteria group bacterium]